jgi:hypothetical protein
MQITAAPLSNSGFEVSWALLTTRAWVWSIQSVITGKRKIVYAWKRAFNAPSKRNGKPNVFIRGSTQRAVEERVGVPLTTIAWVGNERRGNLAAPQNNFRNRKQLNKTRRGLLRTRKSVVWDAWGVQSPDRSRKGSIWLGYHSYRSKAHRCTPVDLGRPRLVKR